MSCFHDIHVSGMIIFYPEIESPWSQRSSWKKRHSRFLYFYTKILDINSEQANMSNGQVCVLFQGFLGLLR